MIGNNELVKIRWYDASDCEGWNFADQIEETCSLAECQTVGYIVKETTDYITITSTIAFNGAELVLLNPLSIPKACIKSRFVLGTIEPFSHELEEDSNGTT